MLVTASSEHCSPSYDTWLVTLQTASTTTMHLNILTGFQLRIREALRWVSPASECYSSGCSACSIRNGLVPGQQCICAAVDWHSLIVESSSVSSLSSSHLVAHAFSQCACLDRIPLSLQGDIPLQL